MKPGLMILTVRIPSIERLLPSRATRGEIIKYDVEAQLVTSVLSVTRIELAGAPREDRVSVVAYIPPLTKVLARADQWAKLGYLRTHALVSENKKTLAPFLESGDWEWTFGGVA